MSCRDLAAGHAGRGHRHRRLAVPAVASRLDRAPAGMAGGLRPQAADTRWADTPVGEE